MLSDYITMNLYNNFNKKYPSINLSELIWKAATTSNVNAWENAMLEIN